MLILVSLNNFVMVLVSRPTCVNVAHSLFYNFYFLGNFCFVVFFLSLVGMCVSLY
jgi:hypothetical protein